MPTVTDEPAVDSEFGKRFRKAWSNSKWANHNQGELSKVFNYSKQGISFIANGYRYPHLSSGLKMAKEFNVCLDWLYTGRDPMRPGDPDPYLRLAYKLMPLTGLKMKVMDIFIGLVVDDKISLDELIMWLVDQHGAGLTSEREAIQKRLDEEQRLREGA